MLRLVCMFLGCDMPIQLVLSSEYDDHVNVDSILIKSLAVLAVAHCVCVFI